jgi:hypothetical protein
VAELELDYRASIRPFSRQSGIFGTGEIMEPLRKRNMLVFPYTPVMQLSGNSEYEEYTFTHSNYKYNAYARSYVGEIVLTADFTSQTLDEAKYTLAAMHFFRSITKSYFGTTDALAGAPPPVVKFNYMGNQQFKDVPVIIKNYTYTLQPDVDYVTVVDGNINTSVPTFLNIALTMDLYYNPRTLKDTFSLQKFRNGTLLQDGYI